MSNAPVSNTVAGIFGQRGSGKTEFLRGNEELKIPGFINMYLEKGMKVLILDTLDHTSYRDIPVIAPEKIHKWLKGVRRMWVRPSEYPVLIQYLNTLGSMYNTFIVFEDAYKHLKKKFYEGLEEFIIDSKQKNIDMVFMYHCWGWAPPDLFRVLDLIEVFKTKDSPKSRKDEMPGYYDDAMRVYEKVKNEKSNYYHELLDTQM